MTKAIWAALMAASSILPAVASAQGPQDRGDRPQLSDAQHQAHTDRRAERQADRRGDGGQDRAGQDRRGQDGGGQNADRSDRGDRGDRARGDAGRGDGAPGDRRRDERGGDGHGPQVQGGGRFADGRYDRDRANDRGGFERRGGYDVPRFAAGSPRRWSNDWRRDGRYDWNRHRAYDRDAYRLPRYYAPGGWGYGYRRFSIGARIAAPLFGRNYWIADPWAYRLPAAYGPYRWVRYYDDAVLVDLRTGYVVDTVYGIFW